MTYPNNFETKISFDEMTYPKHRPSNKKSFF